MIGLPFEKEGSRMRYICVKIKSLGKEKMKHLKFLKNGSAVTWTDMGGIQNPEKKAE
jgi:hypothetical protein